MIGAMYTHADIGKRRRNWRMGCDEELRLFECEACGQQQAQYEPDHPPEPGWIWAFRCVSCGSVINGRRDGEDPLAHAEAPLSQRVILPGGVR